MVPRFSVTSSRLIPIPESKMVRVRSFSLVVMFICRPVSADDCYAFPEISL